MIHHILQTAHSEDTQDLMPRATHVVEIVSIIQPLILKPPLNIGI
jgi:hypothetical protein